MDDAAEPGPDAGLTKCGEEKNEMNTRINEYVHE